MVLVYEQINICDITAIKIYEEESFIGVSSKDRTVRIWKPAFEQFQVQKIEKVYQENGRGKANLEEIMEYTGFDSLNTYEAKSFNANSS